MREAGAVFQVKEDRKKGINRKRLKQMEARCDGSSLTVKWTKSNK